MKFLSLLLPAILTFANLAYSEETPPPYVTLASGQFINGRSDIVIPEGYLVELISLSLATGTQNPGIPSQPHTFSNVRIDSDYGGYNFNTIYTSDLLPTGNPKFLGPAIVSVQSEGGSGARAIVCLKITKPTESNLVPANAVVIPTDAEGPVSVILESSADLVSWTAADPGTYGASEEKRFFRVRAVVAAQE